MYKYECYIWTKNTDGITVECHVLEIPNVEVLEKILNETNEKGLWLGKIISTIHIKSRRI